MKSTELLWSPFKSQPIAPHAYFRETTADPYTADTKPLPKVTTLVSLKYSNWYVFQFVGVFCVRALSCA